jgi:hypothetical protein
MHDFSEPQTESGGMTRWLIIGGIVFVVLSIVFIVLSIIYPGFREAVRDLAIILLALFQLIGAIALALVAVAILYAVKAIDTTARTTLIPKLSEISTKVDELLVKTASVTDDVKKTSASVSSTVTIISEQIVKPAIQVSSIMAGLKAAANVLGQRVTGSNKPKATPHKDSSDV